MVLGAFEKAHMCSDGSAYRSVILKIYRLLAGFSERGAIRSIRDNPSERLVAHCAPARPLQVGSVCMLGLHPNLLRKAVTPYRSWYGLVDDVRPFSRTQRLKTHTERW